MNTDPNVTTILCYGDSNTWGQNPDMSGRYAANVRWTGQLQNILGKAYYVIEEGLSSRTTDLEYSRKPGRNGKTYLLPCLASHNPIDIVVLMLGTNDLKIEFRRSAQEIAGAIEGLVGDIRQNAWNQRKMAPEIVIISPVHVDGNAPDFERLYSKNYDKDSIVKSRQLASEISLVASKQRCHFLDAAEVSRAGVDGIHFDEASHAPLAQLVADRIGLIFSVNK